MVDVSNGGLCVGCDLGSNRAEEGDVGARERGFAVGVQRIGVDALGLGLNLGRYQG